MDELYLDTNQNGGPPKLGLVRQGSLSRESPSLRLQPTPGLVRAPSLYRTEKPDVVDWDSPKPTLSQIELFQLALPSIAIETGWAVSEALIIPYLISMGVSETVANMAWLVNPLVGIFLQPFFGHWSDRCESSWGRRRPFIVAFNIGSVLGLVIVSYSSNFINFFFGEFLNESVRSSILLSALFFGFGLMDLSHDLLTIPARALLNDTLSAEQLDAGNSYFVAVGAIGRMLGMGIAMSPVQKFIPLGDQVQTSFIMAALVITLCNIFSVIRPEAPLHTAVSDTDSEDGSTLYMIKQKLRKKSGSFHKSSFSTPISPALVATQPQFQPPPSELTPLMKERDHLIDLNKVSPDTYNKKGYTSLSDVTKEQFNKQQEEQEILEREKPSILYVLSSFTSLPSSILRVWLLDVFWWYANLTTCFWWTSWVAMEVEKAEVGSEKFQQGVMLGSMGLFVTAVSTLLGGFLLPPLNNLFSVRKVYQVSAFLYGLIVFALWFFRTRWAIFVFMILQGCLQNVLTSSPYILIETDTSDADSKRGLYSSLIGLCMTFAQILVGCFSGVLGQLSGGITGAIAFSGLLLLITSVLIPLIPCPNSKSKEKI